tara:strand:+ start:2014 stop:2214 length:201 start_codon:yes stop_codon:yes gene_type:complete
VSSFEAGDVVVHKMSRVQIHDFSRYKNYSSSPGIVLKNDREKSLILWNSYTEWVDHAYLLKISKVN